MFDVLESMAACGSSALVLDVHGVRILRRMIFLATSNAPFGQLELAPFDLLQLL
jgi:hypothetical protein|tara:strand:+ start:702 stop:863 length:162 start_codon:yes stop_codon:yes gene_type:complete